MVNKKKRTSNTNKKIDIRGYATTAQATTTAISLQQETKLSNKQQQEHLQSLIDVSSSSSSSAHHSSLPTTTWKVDTTTKEFYKRIDSLYHTLLQIGFKDHQVESIFIGLTKAPIQQQQQKQQYTIESALDWACLQLPTQDLPPIFTEGHLRDAIMQESKTSTIQVLQVATVRSGSSATTFWNEETPTVADTTTAVENLHLNDASKTTVETSLPEIFVMEETDKTWILNQYQYESDNDNNDNDEPSADPAATPSSSFQEDVIVMLPEQLRLTQLEQDIQILQSDLKDDATNYMRSKQEIKEMKKSLQKLQGERNKLNTKLAKLLISSSKLEEPIIMTRHVVPDEPLPGKQDDEDDNCIIFDMFQESDIALKIPPTPIVQDEVNEQQSVEDSTDPFQLSSREASITKDWTGKTPKQLLEDHCKKNKIPRPSFIKVVGTKHGCRVTVKVTKGTTNPPLVLEHNGPFYDWNDAQHYVSTHALYIMAPELPLYRLMPPVFSNLYKSWLQHAQDVQKVIKDDSAREKDEKIRQLISLISAHSSTLESKPFGTTTLPKIEDHIQVTDKLETWDDSECSNTESDYKNLLSTGPTILGRTLQRSFMATCSKPEYLEMQQSRETLPMHAYREQLLETIDENSVTVLHAETGAGKTTQCPQFLLEQALLSGVGDAISILCTQPRRISALTVAERVAEEMCDPLGHLVGYQIRMESKKTSKTRLLFCTTGVLLRRLQDDPNLMGVTHVVVDEVHERQWQIDFLLIALRKIVQTTRRDLKIILMSATLDAKLFCSFFGNAPLLSVPGRTFPVANYYLEDLLDATGHMIEEDSRNARRDTRTNHETQSLFVTTRGGEKRQEVVTLESQTDVTVVSGYYGEYSMATQRSMDRVDEFVINYDLIEDVLTLIVDPNTENTIILPPEGAGKETMPNGAVLIFLPGMGEIRALADRLKGSRLFGNSKRFDIIPMHSSLSPQDQKRAFHKPNAGCRKVILATNIAETSVTIPDCVCVIDSGLGREVRQDQRFSTSRLVLDWCSKASAKQRAGRAGRVQAGICCKLYSSRTHHNIMKPQAMPELQRVPLEEVCLSILAGKLANNCLDFLRQAPQPPTEDAVQVALDLLQKVGAIDEAETLTPLGLHLSKIPVHVTLAKMLIFGSLFGCLDKILTIVGSLACKSPFSIAINNAIEAQARHRLFQHASSDFLTSCNVWEAFRKARGSSNDQGRDFCRKNYLNWTALVEIGEMRRQNLDLMSQIGFVRCSYKQINATDDWLVTSEYNCHDKNDRLIHAVICAGLYPNVAHAIKLHREDLPLLWHKTEQLYFHSSSVNHRKKSLEEEWIVFHEKFGSGRTTVSATAPIHPFALLLFGGSIQVKHLERKVFVDDWIKIEIAAQTGVMFRELRRRLNFVLTERIELPDSQPDQEILAGIVRLFSV